MFPTVFSWLASSIQHPALNFNDLTVPTYVCIQGFWCYKMKLYAGSTNQVIWEQTDIQHSWGFELQLCSLWYMADSRVVPSQWETSLQSNAISHWLGTNLKSTLWYMVAACENYPSHPRQVAVDTIKNLNLHWNDNKEFEFELPFKWQSVDRFSPSSVVLSLYGPQI